MKSAADSPFAARMMAKPRPESLNSDPAARIFFDPPEMIQMAFGGRPWFFETGCRSVHRVGLFKGIGWELDPVLNKQHDHGVTGVRITARNQHSKGRHLYDLLFLAREVPEDHLDPLVERIVTHRPGLTIDQLKAAYGEVLGPAYI